MTGRGQTGASGRSSSNEPTWVDLETGDPASVDRVLARLKKELLARDRHVFVLTMHAPGTERSADRYFLWLQTSERDLRERVLAIAFVTPGFWARCYARLLFWMGPPPTLYRIFGSQEEGMAWGRSLLAG